MTPEEAKAILLEQAVERARSTIDFLFSCLEHPDTYSHADPDQTKDLLKELEALAPGRQWCVHSITRPDCESCLAGHKSRMDRYEAKKVLGQNPEFPYYWPDGEGGNAHESS